MFHSHVSYSYGSAYVCSQLTTSTYEGPVWLINYSNTWMTRCCPIFFFIKNKSLKTCRNHPKGIRRELRPLLDPLDHALQALREASPQQNCTAVARCTHHLLFLRVTFVGGSSFHPALYLSCPVQSSTYLLSFYTQRLNNCLSHHVRILYYKSTIKKHLQ